MPVAPDPQRHRALSSGNPIAWDFNLKATHAMQWSIGVQREIVPNLLLGCRLRRHTARSASSPP